MPKISVIIPNYNHARFLEKRIVSVLNQTYPDFEIIFLDDASTDDSLEICQKYFSLNNFRIDINKVNGGCTFKQWNKGVRIAEGEYIWIAESDDIGSPHLLERLANILHKNPNVGIVYCQSYYIDENDDIIGIHLDDVVELNTDRWRNDFIMNGKEMLKFYMVAVNAIPNASAVLFRKKLYNQIEGADENMRLCGDWMTWSKMLLSQDIGFIAEPLNSFRIHKTTVRNSLHFKPRYLIEYIQVVKFICNSVNVGLISKKAAYKQIKMRWLRICLNYSGKISNRDLLEVIRQVKRLFGGNRAVMFVLLGVIIFFMAPLLRVDKIRGFSFASSRN